MLGNTTEKIAMASAFICTLALATVPAHADENSVCFFNGTNFEGAAFCTSAGTRKGMVEHPFGKRFRSVQLTGSAVVHICEYSGFGGRCMVVEKSQPDLDALYVNNVESFEVLTVESSGARFFNHVGYADSGVHHAGE
jgi:Peptidase inhibitor family I36